MLSTGDPVDSSSTYLDCIPSFLLVISPLDPPFHIFDDEVPAPAIDKYPVLYSTPDDRDPEDKMEKESLGGPDLHISQPQKRVFILTIELL